MRIVTVEWEDPCFCGNGWMGKSEFLTWIKKGHTKATSVGFLVFENDDFIVLLQSIGDELVADGVKITRTSIKKIQQIGEASIDLEFQIK